MAKKLAINAPQTGRKNYHSCNSGPTVKCAGEVCCLTHIRMGLNDTRVIFIKVCGITKAINSEYFSQIIEENFGIKIVWPEKRKVFELNEILKWYVDSLKKQGCLVCKVYKNYLQLVLFLAKQFGGVVNANNILTAFIWVYEEE